MWVVPQELFTTWGRLAGFPSGATIQSAQVLRANSEHELDSQPLQAIQVASGAMPACQVRLGSSSATMVPMVWVPCPLLSQALPPQMLDGSSQQAGSVGSPPQAKDWSRAG